MRNRSRDILRKTPADFLANMRLSVGKLTTPRFLQLQPYHPLYEFTNRDDLVGYPTSHARKDPPKLVISPHLTLPASPPS